jgi:hypothetical protein
MPEIKKELKRIDADLKRIYELLGAIIKRGKE